MLTAADILHSDVSGMTFRELAALSIHAALVSHSDYSYHSSPTSAARQAVEHARALAEQLAKTAAAGE